MIQLLAPYTDPECHNAQSYRQTNDIVMSIADYTACSMVDYSD